MYQGFPHQKRKGAVYSTFFRLFSGIIVPGMVLFVVLSIYPVSGQAPDAILSGASALDFYESYQAGDFARSAFQALKEAILQSEFSSNTLRLHCRFADPDAYGLSADPVSLGSYSIDSFVKYADQAALFLERLREIPRESLSAEEQLSYDILEWQLIQSSQADDFALFTNPLSSVTGSLSELPVLLMEYPFRSEDDPEVYLALLKDLPRYVSELLSFAQQKADCGIAIPSQEIQKSIESCTAFCSDYAKDPEHHFLVSSFEESLDSLDLTEEERAAYAARNRSLLSESVIPAYEKTAEGLKKLLADSSPAAAPSVTNDAADHAADGSAGTDSLCMDSLYMDSLCTDTLHSDSFHTAAGLCTVPGGEAYYRYLIVSQTGTSRTAEELTELITNRMVSDIRAMDELYQTCPEIGTELKTAAALTDPQHILIDLQSKMRNDFPVLSSPACQIQLIPEVLEENMKSAFYLIPPIDAPDEGCIFLNSSSLSSPNLYLTLAHEGFPGHLYQTVYFSSTTEEPVRSLIRLPGYTEGWATYAERQAYYYIDGYSDATAEFLRRNASAAMALYALCDLNIHLKGWSPADMSHFLQVWVKGLTEEAAAELYDAIIADPGNYLNYHVGAMEFELLREEAKARLGDAFDQKDFHAFLLQTGPCPFHILRRQFEEWLKNAASA